MAAERQRGQVTRKRVAQRVASVVSLVVLGAVLPSCGSGSTTKTGDTGAGSSGPSVEQAQRAHDRLDSAMTSAFNKAQAVSVKPFACLQRSPSGGPALAACVPSCQACAIDIGGLKKKVRAAYTGSPRYLRSIYRAAYAAEVKNLNDHAAVLGALGGYARVHGASRSAGMAEFDRAKGLIKTEDASAKRYLRLVTAARARFRRYLAKLG